MRRVAKFEKVSEERFVSDLTDAFPEYTKEQAKEIYLSLRLPEREDNRAAHRLNSAGRDADGIPACIFQDAGLHAVVQ